MQQDVKWLETLITELDKAAGLWVTKLNDDEEEGEDEREGKNGINISDCNPSHILRHIENISLRSVNRSVCSFICVSVMLYTVRAVYTE